MKEEKCKHDCISVNHGGVWSAERQYWIEDKSKQGYTFDIPEIDSVVTGTCDSCGEEIKTTIGSY